MRFLSVFGVLGGIFTLSMAQLLIGIGSATALASFLRTTSRIDTVQDLERFRVVARRQLRAVRAIGIMTLVSALLFALGYSGGFLDTSKLLWVVGPLVSLPALIWLGAKARKLEAGPQVRSEYEDVCRAWKGGLRAGDVPSGGLSVLDKESGMLSRAAPGVAAAPSAAFPRTRVLIEVLAFGVAFLLLAPLTAIATIAMFGLGSPESELGQDITASIDMALEGSGGAEGHGRAEPQATEQEVRGSVSFHGAAVAGARVVIRPGHGGPLVETVTDPQGEFVAKVWMRAYASVRVEDVEGLRLGRGFVSAREQNKTAKIELSPAGLVVVRVVDEAGSPLPAAVVRGLGSDLSESESPPRAPTTGMLVSAEKHRILVSLTGYGTRREELEVSAGKRTELEVRLEKLVPVSGVAVFEDGAPGAGLELSCARPSPEGHHDPEDSFYTATDPKGAFRCEVLPGDIDIRLLNTGPQTPTRVKAPAEQLRIVSRGLARVHGVLSFADGTPAERDAVLILAPNDSTSGRSSLFGVTGERGSFEFKRVPPGEYTLSDEDTSASVAVTKEGDHEVKLVRNEPSPTQLGSVRLSGRILDDRKKPMLGAVSAVISAGKRAPDLRSSETRGDGSFDLGRVVNYPVELTFEPKATNAGARGTATLRVLPGPDLVIEIPSAVRVKGRLKFGGGRPPGPVVVAGETTHGESFEVDVPRSSRSLRIIAPGHEVLAFPVPSTEADELDLGEIPLQAGRKTTGRVIDPQGSPVAGAQLHSPGALALSDPAGRFELASCPADELELRVGGRGFAWSRVTLSCGAEQDITLTTGAMLRGEVRLGDGRPARAGSVTVQCPAGTAFGQVRDGSFEVKGAAAGRCVVAANVVDARLLDSPTYAPVAVEVPASGTIELQAMVPVVGTSVRVGVTNRIIRGDLSVSLRRLDLPRAVERGFIGWRATQRRGAFVFSNVPEGEYELCFDIWDRFDTGRRHHQKIIVGSTPLEVEVTLPDQMEFLEDAR
ncbi:MAG: hypothetical protein HYV07_10275 [Deltaproteobacteria bacterium]|nr:hypothetical protein [Deltaproteobacteria bacterium]